MALQYSPKIVQDSLVMCLDASQNKSYPTDLPVKNGLLVWLDAADDSTFSYSSGTEVSQWRDKSGNNLHANQATTANQPSRNTVVNSRKSVNFTSANGDRLRVNSGMVFTNSVTAIVFIKPGSQNYAYANILDQDHGMDGANGWVIQRNNAASAWLSWVANAAGDTWFNPNQVSYTDNTPQIVTLRKGSSTITLYNNGTTSGDVSVADQQIRQANYFGLNIGSWRAGGFSDRHYNGEICEIVVYNRALSLTELKQVHTYLGQKWGISNTDRSFFDLTNNNTLLLGGGNTTYMPYFDYYNKGGLKFDGSNDLATTASAITYGTNTTWEAWVNRSVSANEFNMFMGAYLPYFGLRADGSVIFSNTINSTQQTLYSAGFTSSNDTWYYLSFTTDYNGTSTTARIYINGVLNNSATFTGSQSASGYKFGIGDGRGDSTWYPFNGKVSNVKIYNRTLSAAEISQNYEAQKSKFANTIVQQGLVLNLDAGNPYSYAGAGAAWYDVSGNGYVSSLTNTQTYNSDNGGSINFNGSTESVSAGPNSNLFLADMTAEVWIKITAMSGDWVRIIGTGSDPRTFGLWYYVNGRILWQRTGSSAVNPEVYPVTPVLTVGSWAHVAATTIGMSHVLYLNGVSIGTNPSAGGPWGNSNTAITIGYAGYHAYSNSNIASARLYTRGLSAAEILQNYNATKGRFGL
jgi:hypothetical protein